MQAGAELLGLDSAAADAECVALLCDALAGLGLPDFTVTLGTVAFQRALIDSLGLADDDRGDLHRGARRPGLPAGREHRRQRRASTRARSGRSGASSSSAAATTRSAQARKLAAQRRHGGRRRAPRPACATWSTSAGYGDRLAFDFGLMQDLGYYSGLIFEAYAPGVGLPLATGGRYDGLLGALRLGHPRRRLRDRRRPRRRRAGRGRRRSCRRAPARSRSSAASRRRRGRRSCAAPVSPSARCRTTPRASSRRCCCGAAARISCGSPTAARSRGGWPRRSLEALAAG